MFLKKIIISGFKSFADRITINLDKNHITGIVGPNGSGKSNVIDSVRWVMGEQNAKMLRGEKATDIIFAGSEKRKALGMAEVTLVFDNAEGSHFCPPEYRHEPEVSLTRRLYIDGQREYLINKKQCRLKDIISFFSATGLGGRSYSMIQQGQVDRILQAKPEEIREILEEAAGTLVFKKRKFEALKKLENTRLNLSRIDDILREVERQKTALQEQVEKARKYKTISEDLRTKEISLLAHNHKAFSQKIVELRNSMQAMNDREIALMGELSEFENKQLVLQAQLDEADPEVQALNEAISILRENIARSETQLMNAIQLLEGSDERLMALSRDIAEDDATLKELELKVETRTRDLSEAEEKAVMLKEQLESFQDEMERATEEAQVFSNKIEEFEDELKNLDRLMDSNKIRQENVETNFTKAERARNENRNQLLTIESDLGRSSILLDAAQVKVANRRKGLDVELQEKHNREQAIGARTQEIQDTILRRDELKEHYFAARAKFASLQELEANSNDVSSIVAKLLEADEHSKKLISGVLTDFISFNKDSGELSDKASAVFEKWAERIIVKDVNDFNGLVRIANQQKIGGIPVCILDAVQSIDGEKLEKWKTNFDAEPFTSFISVNNDIPGLNNFLSRIYHIPSLMVEAECIATLPHGIIALTAQGVLFSGQDEFIVGCPGGKGALSRKNEMEALAENLKKFQGKLAEAQGQVDQLEAKQIEDRQIIKEIDQKLQNQNQAVIDVMSELQRAQQQVDSKKELLEARQKEYQELSEVCDKCATELETLRKNYEALEIERNQTSIELEDTKEQSSELIERKEELVRINDNRKIDLVRAETTAHSIKESFQMLNAQLDSLQVKLTRKYQEKDDLLIKIEQAKVSRGKLEQDIEVFILQREEKEDVLASKREENAGIIEELRVAENRLRDLRAEQHKIQKVNSDKNVELERVTIGLNAVLEQSSERYQLDISQYDFEEVPNFDAAKQQKEVSSLRTKIESMGPINMMAIDEFDELSKREDFILSQKDEVISSVDLLETAIEEIESNSETKFMETFITLNQEFQGLFPILFPGGDAKIELTNPEQPLEGGVEILVRLPGKKQQNMRLFSGGEKALTAIALIFALLKSKPTPFCFLDEVDAPLDETNVGRYNAVLEALSDRFQFIVITHNRRTMEVLDTLYGVTMQEPGVSKVVGVDMSREIPAHLKKAFKEEPGKNGRPEGASAFN